MVFGSRIISQDRARLSTRAERRPVRCSRFFFGDKKRVAVRVEMSVIDEGTFDETSTHVSLTGGFTWRLGGQK